MKTFTQFQKSLAFSRGRNRSLTKRFFGKGMTLVEILVSLTLMLLVILAATAVVTYSSGSFNNLDQTTQMRENARFAKDLITRSVLQAGYQDLSNNTLTRKDSKETKGEDPEPDIRGFNNSVKITADIRDSTDGSRTSSNCSGVTSTACVNGSDILIIRYQASVKPENISLSDGSMINCFGSKDTPVLTSSNDRAMSAFHVSTAASEPNLSCAYISSSGTVESQPLIQGVESLQFLFGVDGVAPGLATPSTTAIDNFADRYLRADQITVAGDDIATRANWRRVRSVKVGMVLRGPIGSAADNAQSNKTLYLFGETYQPSSGDEKAVFTPAQDGRLRMVVNFTVHLRNDLHLR
jgi:type IV pilus assembly protein PilW